MKSLFLQKLSELLIPDKTTDYIDFYNLQSIKNWPLLTVMFHDSETETSKPELVLDLTKHKPEDIELMDLEYSELISFTDDKLTIDAGGEWQGLYRVVIFLNESQELAVDSCGIVPELLDTNVSYERRRSEEEYEILLEELQTLLENQD